MTSVALKRGTARKPAKRVITPQRFVSLPLHATVLRRHIIGSFSLLLLAAATVTLTLLGLPQKWWMNVAQAAGRAGFEVRHVDVRGVKMSEKLPVYKAAFSGSTNSMLLVDIDAVRARLTKLPWVQDASVSRRLPDTLRVIIHERVPIAVWQYQQRLALIDRSGKALPTDHLEKFAALPLIIGQGANLRVDDALALLATDHPLAGKINSVTLISNRRWDLRFISGETLALPEGQQAAHKALASFARLNAQQGLLDKGFARFDLRLPGRMTVKLQSDVAAAAAPSHELTI